MASPSTRRRWPRAMLFAALCVGLTASVTAAGDGPGNNGTVKVHSEGEVEPAPEVRNEPHVTCPWHVHFFFGDGGQSGTWTVTDMSGAVVAGDDYTADPNGEARSDPQFVPEGHYSLNWSGDPADRAKHKTFKVDGPCDGGEG